MEKVLSLPAEGGKIILVSNSPTSFLSGLKSLVDEGYDDKRYEIDRVCKDLDDRKIKYDSIVFQTKWAIEKGAYDDDIATIIQWLSLGSSGSFSPKKKKAVSNYIAENSVEANGRIFFAENEIILVVPAS
jgi:hypothetical protein